MKDQQALASGFAGTDPASLPLPNFAVETPCFIVLEDALMNNIRETARGAGGVHRLMPHIKTHRAAWIVSAMLKEGVTAFKTATAAEVEICLNAGAHYVVWAYPTVNPVAVARVASAARKFPTARVDAMVDSEEGASAWIEELKKLPASNIRLRVDLDPGLGRTGMPIAASARDMGMALQRAGLFGGWHAYDGHIQDADRKIRQDRVSALGDVLRAFLANAQSHGLNGDLIAGGSYSFDIWPEDLVRWVSPGSFTYSSAQHDIELHDTGWQIAAYVLATVLSLRDGTATLDAGSKAISPDIPALKRFRGPGTIKLMKEEHAIIFSDSLEVGDQVALIPTHGCTAAYLYTRALVRTGTDQWEYRNQLGATR
ncbi:MAG: alanine racemase [Herminiimonas sp.]|nr:alanine racemase [Herminiimonas sp.]